MDTYILAQQYNLMMSNKLKKSHFNFNLVSRSKSSLARCLHRAGKWTSFITVQLSHAAISSEIELDGTAAPFKAAILKTLQNVHCFEG